MPIFYEFQCLGFLNIKYFSSKANERNLKMMENICACSLHLSDMKLLGGKKIRKDYLLRLNAKVAPEVSDGATNVLDRTISYFIVIDREGFSYVLPAEYDNETKRWIKSYEIEDIVDAVLGDIKKLELIRLINENLKKKYGYWSRVFETSWCEERYEKDKIVFLKHYNAVRKRRGLDEISIDMLPKKVMTITNMTKGEALLLLKGATFQMPTADGIDAQNLFAIIERHVNKGDVEALTKLGLCFLNGLGTDKDEKRGLGLLERSAYMFNNPEAQYALGEHGLKIGQYQNAFRSFNMAANNEYPKAYWFMGTLLNEGIGCAKNPLAASLWFTKAKEAGIKERPKSIIE